ncbi:MAG: PepSY domain-containing protein [Bryobacterales bacterium]|nr:PepSY domain-containing protein [Bryobacterales bacterium]
MKLFRRVLFWSHLVGGLAAALVILLMSFTGVMLTYEKQMIAWADRDFRLAEAPDGVTRLPLGELVGRVAEARKAIPSGIVVESDPLLPVAFQYGRAPVVYVNPYSGEVLGEGGQRMRAFMAGTREWHRWLAVSGDNRPAARAITGAANVVFLFLVISGLYLWLPKAISWKYLRPIVWFRGGLSGKARDFNWHNAAGFWCAVPLFFVVFSAVFISYPAASKALVEWFDGPSAVSGTASPSAASAPKRPERKEWPPSLDTGWQQAVGQMPDWRTISLQLPKFEDEALAFSVASGNGGQPQHRGTLTVHPETGARLAWEPFESLTAGRRARLWVRFVHTGEYYGVVGQTIAGIVSAGGVLLVYSGIALSVRRFLAWRARRRKFAATDQELPEAA